MTSIVETTAVALRRGNREQNEAFVGVEGELVVDLGTPSEDGTVGVAADATLRFHNGITPGGIPMAREDLQNITTENLAENRDLIGDKNLAYADLSNLSKTTDENAISKIKTTFKTYGFTDDQEISERLKDKVDVDTLNLNTSYLASEEFHDGTIEGNYPLAYSNTTNINTADLANARYHNGLNGNYPIAYNNLSNVDTTNLTKLEDRPETISGPVLATTTLDNVDTSNITNPLSFTEGNLTGPVVARADLSNVNPDSLSDILNQNTFGLEKTSNKDSVINENLIKSGHYPETQAVINYISTKTFNSANIHLTNVVDWQRLYHDSNEDLRYNIVHQMDSQNGFELGRAYNTGIYLKNDPQEYLSVSINVDSNGTITDLEINGAVGSIDLTPYNPFVITSDTNVNASFSIISTLNDDMYEYQIDSIIDGGSGFNSENEYIVKSSVSNEYYKIVYNQLQIIPTQLTDTLQENGKLYGKIDQLRCDPEYTFTNVTNSSVTITSSTNTTATLSIVSQLFNTTPGAGVAKIDLTNLKGMTATDQLVEEGSPWRIRHDEGIPSLSQSTIPEEQDYTMATNGNVWRALKNLPNQNQSMVNVVTQYFPNDKSLNPSFSLNTQYGWVPFEISQYGESISNGVKIYLAHPNKSYYYEISHDGGRENYDFTTTNGNDVVIHARALTITFNVNVDNAQIFYKNVSGHTGAIGKYLTNRTITLTRVLNTEWEIKCPGYSSVSGIINVMEDEDQTINVTLEPESQSSD